MKRLLIGAVGIATLAALAVPAVTTAMAAPPAGPSGYNHKLCDQNAVTCTELNQYVNAYTGHDEPSVLFYSNKAGSGNNNTYALTLPKDPPTLPQQDGSGGTFGFQLHPAFWFGMAMCDDQSAPNPGGSSLGANVPCTSDSDTNIYTSSDPTSPNYIGLHPGTAFMEMQFYPPGWVPWPAGNSCDSTQWCAALNIDSLSQNMNTGQTLNPTCAGITGLEYVNFAFITKNGATQAPANPVDSTAATFTPDPAQDFFMNSGDTLIVKLHDTADGFQVIIHDATTGTTGSMTASAANGFGEVQWAPTGSSCVNIPTNFHPAYATSSENTRVPWAAHSYNVAFADEIGHFEYCGNADATGACTTSSVSDPAGPDGDDFGCFNADDSTRVQIGGCLGTDSDFDGVPYQNTWPGTIRNPVQDAQVHSTPIRFTSPLINGRWNFSRVAFETDLPRIEFATNPPCQRHISNPADPSPGSGCVNPPVGANFYPFFSTAAVHGQCLWQLGGPFIPRTMNRFGGSSATEFGPLLPLAYPAANGQPTFRYNDFRNVLGYNPCPVGD
ncbi:MAG TPA: hypothetical protein VF834_04865 [Streptosporangiaceae bacterium]